MKMACAPSADQGCATSGLLLHCTTVLVLLRLHKKDAGNAWRGRIVQSMWYKLDLRGERYRAVDPRNRRKVSLMRVA